MRPGLLPVRAAPRPRPDHLHDVELGLGTGLRDWKDILGTIPRTPTAPWFAAIWSAFLEAQVGPARAVRRLRRDDVWFCEPWPYGFGLAGLEGFLHHFRVTVSGYHEYLGAEPEQR